MTAAALPLHEPAPLRAVARFDARLLDVDFEAPDGTRLSLVGGGDTVEAAIEAARGALPDGAWRVVRWNDVWGE